MTRGRSSVALDEFGVHIRLFGLVRSQDFLFPQRRAREPIITLERPENEGETR